MGPTVGVNILDAVRSYEAIPSSLLFGPLMRTDGAPFNFRQSVVVFL